LEQIHTGGGSYKEGKIKGKNILGEMLMKLSDPYNEHIILGEKITVINNIVNSDDMYIN
jgi:hypothetical protein